MIFEKKFSDLQIGEQFVYTRTLGEGECALFVSASGDFNPYHIDDNFAKNHRFGKRIVPGLLTAASGSLKQSLLVLLRYFLLRLGVFFLLRSLCLHGKELFTRNDDFAQRFLAPERQEVLVHVHLLPLRFEQRR
jgi:MaoC like domain